MAVVGWRELGADELARQYDNRAAVPEHAQIFADWAVRSAAARQRLTARLDLPYGAHPRERCDLFLPPAPSGVLHVFIHGGYWQAMDKAHFSWLAEPLLARGETVAICGYPLCPEVPLAAIVDSLRRLLIWLRGDYPMAELRLSGHSAGGHLAACLLASEPDVSQAISLSGLFELEPLLFTPVNRALGLEVASARALSPALWPSPPAARLQLVVGELESAEYHRQSRYLQQAWGAVTDTHFSLAAGCHHFSILDWFTVRYPQL